MILKKQKIATLLTFSTKQHTILAQILPKLGKTLHQHCAQVLTFLHLWCQGVEVSAMKHNA